MPTPARYARHPDGLPHAKRRLVLVGDVHGHLAPLRRVLKEAGYDAGTDQLCFVGDLVDGVLDLAIEAGAWAVLGNHDAACVSAAALSEAERPREWQGRFADSKHKKDQQPPITQHQVRWLAALPHVLRIDGVDAGGGDVIVVHAAIGPDGPERTDVETATTLRRWTGVPAASPWAASPDAARCRVVFGHDARLRSVPGATCIDAGVAHGRHMAALVLPDGDLFVVDA